MALLHIFSFLLLQVPPHACSLQAVQRNRTPQPSPQARILTSISIAIIPKDNKATFEVSREQVKVHCTTPCKEVFG